MQTHSIDSFTDKKRIINSYICCKKRDVYFVLKPVVSLKESQSYANWVFEYLKIWGWCIARGSTRYSNSHILKSSPSQILAFSLYHFLTISLRHRVHHRMLAPRVAPQNSLHPQVHAFKNAPFLYGFDHIEGTGGLVAAFVGAQQGRNRPLVHPDGQDYYFFQQLLHCTVILA